LELPDCPTPDGRRRKQDDEQDDKCAIAKVTRSDSNVLLPNTASPPPPNPQIEHQLNTINKYPSFLLQQHQQQQRHNKDPKVALFSSLSHLVLQPHPQSKKPHMISSGLIRSSALGEEEIALQIHIQNPNPT
jgi:hypothetical protein